GQTIMGRDFRDQLAGEAELRWWHNRAAHNSFGLLPPFPIVTINGNDAVVPPFFGYDCYGRELLNCKLDIEPPEDPRVRLPAQQSDRMLLVARACLAGAGLVKTNMAWCDLRKWSPSCGVPLAQLTWNANGPQISLPAPMPMIAPYSRPRIGSGTTP